MSIDSLMSALKTQALSEEDMMELCQAGNEDRGTDPRGSSLEINGEGKSRGQAPS